MGTYKTVNTRMLVRYYFCGEKKEVLITSLPEFKTKIYNLIKKFKLS